ncbi:FecCD family ABC transporter permease [Gephyromycinifex aptenodytis]|uniref:FecCD family ABC transporter permease n=1 Tax=Gephyromycinifex aptenodytis TaxID=2716227 RepID=UPI0014458442|nr:iron ABC transporter permease [Gephyromycinifex aptenodytis]
MASTKRLPFVPLLLILMVVCLVSVVISLAFGSESIAVSEVIKVVQGRLSDHQTSGPFDVIVWELRLPRALLAVTVGAGLSLAGAGMQTLVRNPLADPYLLGISAGAAVGATAVITFGALSSLGIYALSLGALMGALGSAMLVYLIAMAQGGLNPLRLVLSGVVMGSALSSIASFMVFLSDDRAANSVLYWMLGSVAGATWERLVPPVVAVVLASILMFAVHGWLDALATGPDTAAALGINVKRLRTGLFVGLGVLIGVLVAVSGGIGFVGLIVPHAARILVGARHRVLLPVAALGGAVFLLWVDVLSRMAARPQEIPLGVVTGVIGAPAFLLLMGRRRYEFGASS